MVTAAQVREWLSEIPDPEIPAVSVTDLGIVREVEARDGSVTVVVTPTYSGCPATAAISLQIDAALRDRGISRVEVQQRLSPPWTTDWISEEGRAKLESHGIAPPNPAGGPRRCPLCRSTSVERVSQFGSTPCKAQWRCRDCLEPFDYFKCL